MRSFDCPKCEWSGHPSFELNARGKLAATCGNVECGYADPTLGPSDFAQGIAVDKDKTVTIVDVPRDEIPVVHDGKPRRQAEPIAQQMPPRVVTGGIPIATTSISIAPTTTDGIIRALRDRRDILAMKAAEGDAAKVEMRKLNKILSAAERAAAAEALTTSTMTAPSMEH